MARVPLTQEDHRRLVRLIAEPGDLLTPLVRQNLLAAAGLEEFVVRLKIDTDAQTFSQQTIRVLQDHGTLEATGQPALVGLLRLMREIVGWHKEARAFLDRILAPYPEAGAEAGEGAGAPAPTAPNRDLFVAADPVDQDEWYRENERVEIVEIAAQLAEGGAPATREVLVEAARQWALETDPRRRAAAYRVLARLEADERPGVGLDERGLPDIVWLPVPDSGPVWIGEIGEEATLDGLPGQVVQVAAFEIAKYLVTNWQYDAFLNDNGPYGYDHAAWWTGLEKPAEKRPGNWAYGNHPREWVTWFAAVAFCRWLSHKLGCAPGYEVRLPTETEWEKAARGEDGRAYPWGDEYVSGYANVNEKWYWEGGPYYLCQTSAVGMYPDDLSPYGALDMAGNLLEWTLTEWETGKASDCGPAERVLRGGSWLDSPRRARAATRNQFFPYWELHDRGFRVVRPVPPHSGAGDSGL